MSGEEYDFIIDLVETGQVDGLLDQLADVVHARRGFLRDVRGAVNKAAFVPGTKVRVINISPKYLTGITGVVRSQTAAQRRGDLVVDIDQRCWHRLGRYGRTLNIPASSLEEI